jgi:hypothetical protein
MDKETILIHKYTELLVTRIRQIVPNCTVTCEEHDIFVELPVTQTFRIPVRDYVAGYDHETGKYIGRFSDDPGNDANDRLTDAEYVKWLIDTNICPDATEGCQRLRDWSELPDEVVLCPEFVPTRSELEQLAEQLIYEDVDGAFFVFWSGAISRRFLSCPLRSRRINRLQQILGEETMQYVVERVFNRVENAAGQDLVWLFRNAEKLAPAVQEIMNGRLRAEERNRKLSDLRTAAEAYLNDKRVDPLIAAFIDDPGRAVEDEP